MDVYISWVGQVGVDLQFSIKRLSYEFIILDHHFISTYDQKCSYWLFANYLGHIYIVLIILPIMLFGTAIIFLLLYSILCPFHYYAIMPKIMLA